MKTLKEFLIEGILDIENNIENLTEKALIEDFIKENMRLNMGIFNSKKKEINI